MQKPGQFIAAIIAIAGITGFSPLAISQVDYTKLRDAIPIQGTEYLIRIPENWNGVLISDLDYHRNADSPLKMHLLEEGYALSGTNRCPERLTEYDSAHEINDLVTVMDIFEANYGKPHRTIHYGCSGGANVTIGMAEIHPDLIDGAVAVGSVTSQWLTRQHLDGFFVLQTHTKTKYF